MEVVDKLADFSEAAWPIGCRSSEVIPVELSLTLETSTEAVGTLCFTETIEAVRVLLFAEVNLQNETFR